MAIEKVMTGYLADSVKKLAQTKGESFLKGKDTTAFSNLGTNAVEFGANVTGVGVLTYEVAKSLTNGDVEAMVSSMASQAVSDIAARCGKLIAEYTGKATSLVASIPTKIANETNRRITNPNVEEGEERIMTLGEWLTEVYDGQETLRQVEHEKQNVQRKTDKINKAKNIITNTVERANKFMSIANEKIAYVQKYALEGPEWCARQMSNTVDGVELEIRKELDGDFKYLEDTINSFCKTEGNNIGSKVVKKTNNELHNLATKVKNSNEEAITQGKIKAKSVLQKGKLYIMGRLGINIKVPISTD